MGIKTCIPHKPVVAHTHICPSCYIALVTWRWLLSKHLPKIQIPKTQMLLVFYFPDVLGIKAVNTRLISDMLRSARMNLCPGQTLKEEVRHFVWMRWLDGGGYGGRAVCQDAFSLMI